MKTRISRTGLFLGAGAASLVTLAVIAGSTASSTTSEAVSARAPEATPANLPAGVEDVVKLTRAQVGDDVTLNYIRNSGTVYDLAPKDVLYLKSEGVSDQVIQAMSDQGKNVPAETVAQNDSAPALPPPEYAPAPDGPLPPAAPMYAQPPLGYIQQAPVTVTLPVPAAPPPPISTLYIIPDPASGATTPFYPSGYVRSRPPVSTVIAIGGGFSGRRYAAAGFHSGHGSGVCVIGHR
jgi:hypothetical protein